MAAVSTCYISAACNRTVQCVHWGRNGLVAYGSCRSIAIYEAKREKEAGSIVYMVNGHKGRVNCVKWISCPTSHGVKETEMVSGSTDNTAIVWKWNEQQRKKEAGSIVYMVNGHKGRVNCVKWISCPTSHGVKETEMVSGSTDNTAIVWKGNEQQVFHIFCIPVVNLHTVPILSLGRDDCKIHLYVYQDDQFTEVLSLHGHEDWVRGIEFAVDGNDLLLASCSQDTFIRIWRISISIKSSQPLVFNPDTEIKLKENTFIGTEKGIVTSWHEIARPQVHGYDMQCIAMMSRYRMVSGADEKVVRIFSAPKNFIDNFGKICEADESVPEGASVPALGLSNKAIYDGDLVQPVNEIHPNEQYPELYFHSLNMTEPPTEEHLLQNSLWPEIQKLYGHGYEIFSIAAHPHGHVLASACKAAKPEHAAIILWDARTWRQMVSLMAHSLTVTQLAFSHNGKYLLAVSRDRTWSLFRERTTDQSEAGMLIIFDKLVIVWGEKENDGSNPASSCLGNYKPCSSPLDVGEAATAIDFAPITVQIDRYLLGVGCESGAIMLYTWKPTESSQWIKCCVLDAMYPFSVKVIATRWGCISQPSQN
uniref:Elongator complex protein 2 n=1 Tax=Saccoglossus kowalevskii TaxID=10224 RepID=A0ABM0MUW0_SACKO|nr:PREDICTED: elongator complex protein 2-like [Saccoglossus kowalevskii]